MDEIQCNYEEKICNFACLYFSFMTVKFDFWV